MTTQQDVPEQPARLSSWRSAREHTCFSPAHGSAKLDGHNRVAKAHSHIGKFLLNTLEITTLHPTHHPNKHRQLQTNPLT